MSSIIGEIYKHPMRTAPFAVHAIISFRLARAMSEVMPVEAALHSSIGLLAFFQDSIALQSYCCIGEDSG
jgi:hypothetical protein